MRTATVFLVPLLLLIVASPISHSANEGFSSVRKGPLHATRTSADGLHDEVIKYEPSDRADKLWEFFVSAPKGLSTPNPKSEYCPNNSFFEFAPVQVGQVNATSNAEWSGNCLIDAVASAEVGVSGATITISAGSLAHFGCEDYYLICTPQHCYEKIVTSEKAHTISITSWDPYEYQFASTTGFWILLLPCGVAGTADSLLKTAALFEPTPLQLDANKEFLTYKMGWQMIDFNKNTAVDVSNVPSGSYLAIIRFDGLDPMICYGTGGHTGHSAIFTRDFDGNPYVIESIGLDPVGKPYWSPPYGVRRTPWPEWYEMAVAAQYHVGMLALRDDYAAAFNATAAWEWFLSVEGQPYGYHNFLFSFMDTANPMANLPSPINDPIWTVFANAGFRLLGNSSSNPESIFNMLIEGFNHRLSSNCDDMQCIMSAAAAAGMSLGEVTAIPEQDSWRYHSNYSMVCSVFAFETWKAGFGSFIPSPIQGTEQTPKDNYQLAIFNGTFWDESNCPGGVTTNGTGGSYCQLMGNVVLPLNDYNTVPLYPHMNEKCPCQWPSYFRCPENDPTCC